MVQMFRQAPSRRRLLRSLALGSRGGNRTITSADGTELSVRTTGQGHPVVLVHGVLDGIGAFSLVELELAEKYSVWVYDRRGRGGSGDGDDSSLDAEADDLAAVIAATPGDPHVVGHSFGAVIALRANLRGVAMRSLTIYEPPINGGVISPEQITDIRRAVDEDRVDDAIRDMAQNLAGITDEELSIAMRVPPIRKTLRAGVRVVARELEVIRSSEWSGLPVADVPTLVLRGGLSNAAVYPTEEQTPEIATDVETMTLTGQGHLGHVFARSEFVDAVLNFLDRH